jgi:hypothetical protein
MRDSSKGSGRIILCFLARMEILQKNAAAGDATHCLSSHGEAKKTAVALFSIASGRI